MVKNLPTNARDAGSIPGLGRFPPSLGWEDSLGIGKGNSLQYSYLENSVDLGAWRAIVRGVRKSLDMNE